MCGALRTPEMLAMAAILLVFAVACPQTAVATQHTVGGSQGWDVASDMESWASSQTFKVGDKLVFKYAPGLHSVVELRNEKEYDKCDISSALDSMHGGSSVVKLDKPGYRYFACGTVGHCDQGMKLKIKVLASDESGKSSSQASSTPASASTSAAVSSSSCATFVFMGMSMAAVWLISVI